MTDGGRLQRDRKGGESTRLTHHLLAFALGKETCVVQTILSLDEVLGRFRGYQFGSLLF